MKACFVDNAEVPIECSIDSGNIHDCALALDGIERAGCCHWKPEKTLAMCRDLLGDSWYILRLKGSRNS
jgi:hypothetical protein